MKFGRKLLQEAYPQYRHFYLAYKDLKQAIKLITGTDASEYSIKEVTSNFGNVSAFAGSVFRPPESRFQDLLNDEKEKINKFLEVTLAAVNGALRQLLKDLLRDETDEQYPTNLDEVETAVDEQADLLVFLESYQRINHIGFRKITKKYDKHNKSNSSSWYMAQLTREPFLNADFQTPLIQLSLCYGQIRQRRFGQSSLRRPYRALTLPEVREEGPEDTNSASPPESQGNGPRAPGSTLDSTRSDGPVPPEKQRKYLVRPEDLMKLKALLLKFVPLVSIGNETVVADALANEFLNPLHGVKSTKPIVSKMSHCCVYFDTQQFDTYRELVKYGGRRELRTLVPAKRKVYSGFRLRWVGANDGEPEKDIFLEKVDLLEPANCSTEWPDVVPDNHRGNSPNTVVLKQKHLLSLFKGDFDAEGWCARKRFTESRTMEMRDLLQEAQQIFRERGFVPVLQVWYHRTSFRLEIPTGQQVCVHLDESVSFVSEIRREEGRLVFHSAESPITTYTAARADELTYPLSFGLLSVSYPRDGSFIVDEPKVVAEPSDDLRSLGAKHPTSIDFSGFVQMITGLTSVTEIWAFSYFIHGLSGISRQLDLNLQAPHWYNFFPEPDEAENTDSPPPKVQTPIPKTASRGVGEPEAPLSSTHGRVDIIRSNPGDRLMCDHEDELRCLMNHGATTRSEQMAAANDVTINILAQDPAVRGGSSPLLPPPRYLDGAGTNLPTNGGGFLGLHTAIMIGERDQAPTQGRSLEDLSKPLLPQPQAGSGAATAGNNNEGEARPSWWQRTRRWFSRSEQARNVQVTRQGDVVRNAAVRVEPKTFFANERTLLQWMNTAVLLATIAITLLNFGTSTARLAGLILAPASIFFIVHAYRVYARRGEALMHKEPIDYADRSGPFILVVTLVVALSVVVALNVLD